MIVYNVATRFFALKDKANDLRREMQLPVKSIHKITINNREQLAEFLNGLCNGENAGDIAPVECQANVDIPDFVPRFLLADWGHQPGNSSV